MELDIKLSINKRGDAQHNTFLLRWNPAISSYTMERLDNDMSEWAEGYWADDFDWSVHEWQRARKGDRFFMVRDWIDDDYDYGDVVCVKMDDKILIKRIIGKPGDVIELIDGYVYRNGEKIDESAYLDDDVRTEMTGISSKFIVGMNQYFVLGDNRSISLDSRMIGPVSTVQGKTWFFFSKAWFK